MALLFSKVTIQSDFDEVEFIVGGFPTEPDDLAPFSYTHLLEDIHLRKLALHGFACR